MFILLWKGNFFSVWRHLQKEWEQSWVVGGVEVFEEQMLGDQGVLPPGARNAFVPCRDRDRLYNSYCPWFSYNRFLWFPAVFYSFRLYTSYCPCPPLIINRPQPAWFLNPNWGPAGLKLIKVFRRNFSNAIVAASPRTDHKDSCQIPPRAFLWSRPME